MAPAPARPFGRFSPSNLRDRTTIIKASKALNRSFLAPNEGTSKVVLDLILQKEG